MKKGLFTILDIFLQMGITVVVLVSFFSIVAIVAEVIVYVVKVWTKNLY